MPLSTPPLRTSHWLYATIFVALVIPAVLIIGHSVNGLQKKELVTERMRTAAHEISEKVGGLRTLMASLVGLHQVSGQLDDQALLLFSQQITEHSSYVTSIGRYEHVNEADRTAFEDRFSQAGILDFRIRKLDANGKRSDLSVADQYYPISILEPLRPENARLLGADLASLDGFRESLDTIARNNESLLTTFPDSWPYGGQVVLFRPVYMGHQVPVSAPERQKQTAGGFWITVDIERFLGKVAGRLKDFDISIEIDEGDTTRTLYKQSARYDKELLLRTLYPRQQFVEQWSTDNGLLVMRFETQIGYSAVVLLCALLFIVGLVLVVIQITSQRLHQLQRDHQAEVDQQALYNLREKAERTLNAVQDAIITLDANLCISYINPAAVIQFNAKPSNTLGKAFDHIIQFQLADNSRALFDLESALQNLSHNSKGEFEVVPIGHSHSDFILNLTLSSSQGPDGSVTGHVLVIRNVSQEYRLTARLAYQANHDALTGCTNRYHFEQTLAGLIDELAFNQRQHALCYIDLDQFKIVNDTCGHRAGDRLLTELTKHMKTFLRDEDILSRLGGDEFGMLLINATPEQTTEISNRLFQFFQTHTFQHEDKVFAVRASIGIMHIDNSCTSMKDVMSAADIACFAAKDAGRNSMYVYSPTDDTMAERSAELSWLPRLQNALQNDEFVLHVQPVASIDALKAGSSAASSIQHFEFLLRLRNPDGPDFTPWQFIRAAERYDLMRQIDRWVIRNALRTVAELKGSPGGDCSFSINLSGQSAADPSLNSFIQEQYDYYKINPSQIWFELTETAAISHFSVATELFQSIRAMGSLIALDDFGSGLSSFGYLKNMPIDVIKIDGQFVREIVDNKIDRQMLLSMKQLGEVMNIKTVAEFVEDQAILEELIKIGIDYAQGYHLGKPAPVAATMAELFNQQRAA